MALIFKRDIADFKLEVPLTVHRDGKLMEEIWGRDTVERLPILVSARGVDQLLGVPKLPQGTGEGKAAAVYDELLSGVRNGDSHDF